MKKFIAIKTEKGYFISDKDCIDNKYSNGEFLDYFFDGKKPEKTYNNCWGFIENLPREIKIEIQQPSVNHRYELINAELESDKIPRVIDAFCDNDKWHCNNEYNHIKILYELVSDEQQPKLEKIEFEINVIAEIENFCFKKGFDINGITQENLQYQLLDKILFHPDLLQNKKCRLSSMDSYKIIRNHIKKNIDTKYAEIEDYNFCLTVKKKIRIDSPEEYKVDVNLLGKKPKYETRYRNHRGAIVYKIAPEIKGVVYSGFPKCPEFEGNNWEDVEKNINEYLNDLTKEINKPLSDCKYCKGAGVVENI